MSLLADCIVCDYNYVFDPRVYLRRFFDDQPGSHIFLIDEAHNLVDRSREMFSAELFKQAILDVRRGLKDPLPGIYRQLGKINSWMLKARKECEAANRRLPAGKLQQRSRPGDKKKENARSPAVEQPGTPRMDWNDQNHLRVETRPPDDIYPQLRMFLRIADRWLAKNLKTPFRKPLLELYFAIAAFMRIAELYGDNFATCYESDGRDLKLKLYCIDPARHLAEALKRCRSATFFSATLTPFSYFRDLFGCHTTARHLDLPSPFPPQNFQVYIADDISTLYRRRAETKQAVADILGAFVQRAAGNYLVFFPSYRYLQMIQPLFAERCESIDTIYQEPDMSEDDREAFLQRFDSNNATTLAGFAVLGGIFGEGIDLVGRRLTGAAIVGVGLPGICMERELIRAHFAEIGYDYAYSFPGINRVLQAAGRVIRSEHDLGSLLLIDSRYATFRYRSLLPTHWHPARIHSSATRWQNNLT